MRDRACPSSWYSEWARASGAAVCPSPAMDARPDAVGRAPDFAGAAESPRDIRPSLPISTSPALTPLIACLKRVQMMHPRVFIANRENQVTYVGLLVAALFCAVLWKRAQFSQKLRNGKSLQRTHRTGVRIGNALQILGEFVHPHTKHVLQERLREQEGQDEAADSNDPTEHLLRQARRIQRGETLEHITTLVPHSDHRKSGR